MAWTRIPGDVTDFAFAADWGLQREVDNLRSGIALARVLRLFTGNGWRRVDLLGWSQAVGIGYVYLAQESQLPRGHRHVRGFIPVDNGFLTDDPDHIEGSCAAASQFESDRADGIYVDSTGSLANFVAYLATVDPDGMSPVFPWLTNYQAVLAAVTQTYILGNTNPYYHLLAGVFDENGMPTELQFVYTDFGIDFYAAWAPYEPNLILMEIQEIICDPTASPFGGHFADITVPIFHIGAGGGDGVAGEYMATQVGSDDFQSLIVSTNADPYLDFGHVDLFVAYDGMSAEDLVWQPLLEWITSQRGRDIPVADNPTVAGAE